MRKIIQNLNQNFGNNNNQGLTLAVNGWFSEAYSRNGVAFSLKHVGEEPVIRRLADAIDMLGLSVEDVMQGILPIPFVNQHGTFDVSIELLPNSFERIIGHVCSIRSSCIFEGDDISFEGSLKPIQHTPAKQKGALIGAYVECSLPSGEVLVCKLDSEQFSGGLDALIHKKLGGINIDGALVEQLAMSMVFQRMRDDVFGSFLEDEDEEASDKFSAYGSFGMDRFENHKVDPKVYSSWGSVIAYKKKVFSAEDAISMKEAERAVTQQVGSLKKEDSKPKSTKAAASKERTGVVVDIKQAAKAVRPEEDVATEWGLY